MSFFPPLILSAGFMTFVGGLKREKQTIPYLVVLSLCVILRAVKKKKTEQRREQQFVAFRSTDQKKERAIENRGKRMKKIMNQARFFDGLFPTDSFEFSLESHIFFHSPSNHGIFAES